ncbi:MAG: thiamine-phosphate kinase [Sediminibacterium sp.]|nr:thiamine-phosphate kinase [Sediminibacterium sp.]
MSNTSLNELGEFGLIEHLTKNNETGNITTVLSVGDDAAVIDHFGKQTVVSSDLLIEGIHFDLVYTPLKYLGFKAVAVNISDIYAMNALPTQIIVNIAVSNKFTVENISEIYEGIYEACNEYNVDLVGGDTSSSKTGLILSLTAIGEVTPDNFVTRNGAHVNDLICLTGNLGAAYMGLNLLEREKSIYLAKPEIQPDYQDFRYILQRFLKPLPQVSIIEYFHKEQIIPSALIDISDGLSSDLFHICNRSNVGCKIYEDKIPIDQETKRAAAMFNIDPLTCAMHGGEDYELLFCLPQKYFKQIEHHPNISIIGFVEPLDKGRNLITKSNKIIPLTAQGWKHL